MSRGTNDRSGVVATAILVVAGVGIVVLGLGLTFNADEWQWIANRPLGDAASLLQPHNGHLSTVPVVAYRLLFEGAGLRTYVPYLAALAAVHCLAAAAVFVLVRHHTGRPSFALIAVGVAAFFGSGFENLYWAFQIGMVAATACGLWAFVAAFNRRPRPVAVAILLTASLMSSGVGLSFAAAISVGGVAARSTRLLIASLVPLAAFGVWFLLLGATGLPEASRPAAASPLDASVSALDSMVASFGAAVGSGRVGGTAAAAGLCSALLLSPRTRTPVAIAALVAICVLGALVGLFRSGGAPDVEVSSRFMYVGGLSALVAVSVVGASVSRSLSRRYRPIARGVVTAVIVSAILWNGRLLVEGRQAFRERAALTRAVVSVLLDPQADVPQHVSATPFPSAQRMRALASTYGDPRLDILAPWAMPPIMERHRLQALEFIRAATSPLPSSPDKANVPVPPRASAAGPAPLPHRPRS